MNGLYQGRALDTRGPRAGGRLNVGRVLLAALVIAVAGVGLAFLPWERWRAHYLVVIEVRVEGVRYLDPKSVARAGGVKLGQDLLDLDYARVRQALLLHPRIETARVTRQGLRGVRIRIVERKPVLLVRRGEPWEIDSSGVLLEPLGQGSTSDLPVLAGIGFERFAAGTRIDAPEVRRGIAWASALGDRELQLTDQVSEVDVEAPSGTVLHLLDGTRVLAPAWPPNRRTLSALRVTLADLRVRGITARELDLRYQDQVIVRPVDPAREPRGEPPSATRSGAGAAIADPHA